MKTYIKPGIEIMQVVTEQGFLYNSPSRDVGAKQFYPIATSDWETDDKESNVDYLPKQKNPWND